MKKATRVGTDVRGKYEIWHADKEVEEFPNAPWHELVRNHLRPTDIEGRRVLEIGCGRGDFACHVVRTFAAPDRYIAADFSHVAALKGKLFATSKRLRSIEWTVNDIQSLPYLDHTFDTVLSCETIEHVPNPRIALRELARVMKPGGRLFLTTPNYMSPLGLYRGYMRLTGRRYTETGQPINNLMFLPLTRYWIAQTGLTISSVDAIGHYLPYPGRRPIEFPQLNNPRSIMRWLALHSFFLAEKPRCT